jgi:hypothetical protein
MDRRYQARLREMLAKSEVAPELIDGFLGRPCCLSQECYQWVDRQSVELCRRLDTQGVVFVNRPGS